MLLYSSLLFLPKHLALLLPSGEAHALYFAGGRLDASLVYCVYLLFSVVCSICGEGGHSWLPW